MNHIVSSTKPKTVGEELYLVHLRRHEGDEPKVEDFDFTTTPNPTPRDRSLSAGEELWRIHLQRSQGVEGGEEKEEDLLRKEETKPCRYNLRTRTRK
jgi:hypothetical protein